MASLLGAVYLQHSVELTQSFKQYLRQQPVEVSSAFYKNFLQPLLNQYEPSDLQGKYKPSWEARLVASPMQHAMIEATKRKQAHHYHFGFTHYIAGNDPFYAGDVSSGIIHTRLIDNSGDLIHRVFWMHTEHPKPFYCPLNAIDDPI